MTGNICSFPEAEFSHRYKPELTACTGSLQSQASYDPSCNLVLTSHYKNISELTLAYEHFQNFKISWFFRSLTIFTLMRKLYSLNNSFKSKHCQSSHSYIEIRSWKDNYHGLILQRWVKRGILTCCTGLCTYMLSVISHLCRWSLISKIRKSHIRNHRSLFINPGSSWISKDIRKTGSKINLRKFKLDADVTTEGLSVQIYVSIISTSRTALSSRSKHMQGQRFGSEWVSIT